MLKNKTLKICLWILFIFYIGIVLKLTIIRDNNVRDITLIPARVLINNYQRGGKSYFYYLFFGNIGWFFPFGFALPLLIKNMSLKKTIFLTFLFSLFIEASQYIFAVGYSEIDDLILNTLGGALGYLALVKRKVML